MADNIPAQFPAFFDRSSCSVGSGVVVKETYSNLIDTATLKFGLNALKLFTLEFSVDGLAIWEKFPVNGA